MGYHITPFDPAQAMPPTRAAPLSGVLLAAMLLGACARAPVAVTDVARPYRITIQQGNYVTREMVEQLRPGMSKEQVRFILGTPLLTDIFHADRWDYVFYRDAPGARREQRNFAVIFENGRLARVIGDVLPEDPYAVPTKAPATRLPAANPEAKPEATQAAEAPDRAGAVAPTAPAAGNWRAASDAAPSASDAEAGRERGAAAEEPGAEPGAKTREKPARGFLGRMLERIGL